MTQLALDKTNVDYGPIQRESPLYRLLELAGLEIVRHLPGPSTKSNRGESIETIHCGFVGWCQVDHKRDR